MVTLHLHPTERVWKLKNNVLIRDNLVSLNMKNEVEYEKVTADILFLELISV